MHKIRGPALVRGGRLRRRFTHDSRATATRRFCAYSEAFFAVQARNALDVHLPTLSPKQDVYPSLTLPNADFGDRSDP
jgi:hypothetical protein